MFKKLLCIMLILLSLFATGCTGTKQIDKASLAETVTVDEMNGHRLYTFYLLTGEENPESVAVPSESFEKAVEIAKEKYIPDLTLAKFELYAVNEKIYKEVLLQDLKFISEQAYFSPISYVTLCDSETLKKFTEEKDTAENIEQLIMLQKKKDEGVNINCLSIFNNFLKSMNGDLLVSYIDSKNELKAETVKINVKK